jgi:hypothetical protein
MRKLTLLALLAGTMVVLAVGAVAAVTDFRETGTGTAELISEEG